MRTIIGTLLANDSTLETLLTGGVEYTVGEISRTGTPTRYDANKEILPCALVKLSTEGEFGPHEDGSRGFVAVYFYQRSGYEVIDQARERVYALLHRQKVGDASDKVWEVRHAGDVLDQEDPALECSLQVSRYQVVRNRG